MNHPSSTRRRSSRPRGLTLLELLLVLMLLTIVLAVAAPRLAGVTTRNELTSAAAQTRAALMKARNVAMQTGQVTLLLYRPETGFYAITAAPFDEASQARMVAVQSILSSLDEQTAPRNLTAASLDSAAYAVRRLPRDVLFLATSTEGRTANSNTANSSTSNSSMSNSSMSNVAADGTMSSVLHVAFQPDGTGVDGRVILANAENDQIAVSVRGLTGLTEVSELALPSNPFIAGRSTP